jgi:hypothetical protein
MDRGRAGMSLEELIAKQGMATMSFLFQKT